MRSIFISTKKAQINIGGKKYISSSAASKLTGYSSDYIGQLARAGKINSQLIGKMRFVEEESLVLHKVSVQYKDYSHLTISNDSEEPVGQNIEINKDKVKYKPQQRPEPALVLNDRKQKELTREQLSSFYHSDKPQQRPNLNKSFPERGNIKSFLKKGLLAGSLASFAFMALLLTLTNSNLTARSVVKDQALSYLNETSLTVGLILPGEQSDNLAKANAGQRGSASVMTAFFPFVEEKVEQWFRGTLAFLGFGKDKEIAKNVLSDQAIDNNKNKNEGMVIVPKEAEAEDQLKKIKSSFSDEVSIEAIDESTGIITPRFSEGEGDEYLYLMVPIRDD